MKHLIVLNQKAGANKALEEFKAKVDEAFKGLDYEIYLTEGPRAVIPFLREYLAKTKDTVRVYACGGDGTVHEVVNGIVGAKNAELAVLAVGTGNDFVKIYSEEKDWDNIVKNRTGEKRFQDFKSLINAPFKKSMSQKLLVVLYKNLGTLITSLTSVLTQLLVLKVMRIN